MVWLCDLNKNNNLTLDIPVDKTKEPIFGYRVKKKIVIPLNIRLLFVIKCLGHYIRQVYAADIVRKEVGQRNYL